MLFLGTKKYPEVGSYKIDLSIETKSGKEVVEGTYFYIIDAVIAGGDDLQEHGFIQVIH